MEVIIYILMFLIVYSFYYFNIIKKEKGLKKYEKSTEVKYLIGVYKLEKEKLDYKKLAKILGLNNSLIITLTVYLVVSIESDLEKFILGAFVLMLLQLLSYHIIGMTLKKRGN